MPAIRISHIILIVFLFCIVLLTHSATAQSIYDEAARHAARGKAAVDAAKSPGDYETAITEFRAATKLVPNWPNAYYNLGVAQDKAGHHGEAADSLAKYLALAPNSPNAGEVRQLLEKIEFKAGQSISDDDALDIFGSLADIDKWQLNGKTPDDLPNKIRWILSSRRVGRQIDISYMHNHKEALTKYVKPSGKTLFFVNIYYLCDKSVQDDECPEVSRYSLEIVSRRKVKLTVKKFTPAIKPYLAAEVHQHTYEFIKKPD